MIERLPISKLVQVSVFLFGALCLTIASGYSYGPALLLLLTLPFLAKIQSYRLLDRGSLILLGVLLLYVTVQGISILWDGGPLNQFDRPSRLLMAAAIFLFLRQYPPRFLPLMSGIGLGALLAGGIAIYQRFFLGIERALGTHNHPIQGGDISMSMGLISLCSLFWAFRLKHRGWMLFFGLATIMGLTGSLLSGSRGGWILLPLILGVWCWLHRHWFNRKAKVGAALLAGLLLALVLLPQTGVIHRLEQGKQDLVKYFDGGNRNSSLGMRLQLWQSAWLSFQEKPLFGWGNNGVKESQRQQVVRGEIAQSVYDFNSHAHNQYLDEMAKRGLLGLATLLALFLVPLRLFKAQITHQASPEQYALAVAGLVHVMATMDYCLSQAFFGHNSGISFYVFGVVLLLTSSWSQPRGTEGKP